MKVDKILYDMDIGYLKDVKMSSNFLPPGILFEYLNVRVAGVTFEVKNANCKQCETLIILVIL